MTNPSASSPNSNSNDTEIGIHKGLPDSRGRSITPWAWIPSGYLAEAVPNVIAAVLATAMYKKMGIPDETNVIWTGLLYLPWVIKPLWGPLVDKYWTKRRWMVWMQLVLAGTMGGAALALNTSYFFAGSLALLWLMCFASATHDIACDGMYMLSLTERQQAWFVGVRSTFYRFANIAGKGFLPFLVGYVEAHSGLPPQVIQAMAIPPQAEVTIAQPSPQVFTTESGVQIVFDTPVLQVPAGESAHAFVRLSAPPAEGEQVVVTLGHFRGDKGMAIKQGERHVFTSSAGAAAAINAANEQSGELRQRVLAWDTPSTVTIAADRNIKDVVTTDFRATAGNIPLSWAAMFILCAVIYIGFFGYHRWILPYPVEDLSSTAGDVSFFRAAGWLAVTVLVPAVIIVVAYRLMGLALEDSLKSLFNVGETNLAKKGFGLAFAWGRLLVIGLAAWGLMMMRGPRASISRGFYKCSEKSGINFADIFVTFFQRKNIGLMILFLLTFRLGEALLLALAKIFFIELREKGGIALSLTDYGITYGIVGTSGLTLGGILGGFAIARWGMKRMLWPMFALINFPNALYVYLAYTQPQDLVLINALVGLEQFGYGFGFTFYMVYMLFMADGPYKTAHFALATGFMALSLMFPQMASGTLKEMMGYPHFFILVCTAAIPSLILLPFLPMSDTFGLKNGKN